MYHCNKQCGKACNNLQQEFHYFSIELYVLLPPKHLDLGSDPQSTSIFNHRLASTAKMFAKHTKNKRSTKYKIQNTVMQVCHVYV